MPIIQAKLYHKFWDLSHRVMYWCLNIVWSFKSVLTTVSEMLLSTDTDARVMTWQGILKMLRFFMRTPLRPKPTVFGPLQPQLPSLSTSRQAHLFIETDTDTRDPYPSSSRIEPLFLLSARCTKVLQDRYIMWCFGNMHVIFPLDLHVYTSLAIYL